MIETVDTDNLRCEFRVSSINHFQYFALDEFKILRVAGGGAANDIVDPTIIVLAAHPATVHSVGELDENRMLLHDPLDVLAANTNDALVVLIGNMERDGCGHFLLHKPQTLLHGVVGAGLNFDVEVILAEVVKHDLDIALAHDLVDLAILLATNELLMLVGQLNPDTDLARREGNGFNLREDHKSIFNIFVRASNGESGLVKGHIGVRVGADFAEHGLDIIEVRKLTIQLRDPPGGVVELSGLEIGVNNCTTYLIRRPNLPKS